MRCQYQPEDAKGHFVMNVILISHQRNPATNMETDRRQHWSFD